MANTEVEVNTGLLPWVLGGVGLLTVLSLGLVVMFLRSAPKPVEVAGKEDGRKPAVVKPITVGAGNVPLPSAVEKTQPDREAWVQLLSGHDLRGWQRCAWTIYAGRSLFSMSMAHHRPSLDNLTRSTVPNNFRGVGRAGYYS
jgi:hypothetical protein